jgi:ferrochelatase
MVGVILLQLGTPDAPTPAALRRYLREFLSDPRVIDLPRIYWLPILHLIVLPTRPRQSARLYQKVWTPEGSPLLVTTRAQAQALEKALTTLRGAPVPVVVGMRYGHPSIARAIAQLTAAGVDRILAFPMYPQYAGATTGASLEKLFQDIEGLRIVPSIRVVPPYYDDPAYIRALATVTRESLGSSSSSRQLLLSFHGLPKRYVDEGDPYREHCRATTALLEEALRGSVESVSLVFQSQFGREEWLQPYTDKTLEALGRTGAAVAVACPGFTADCLETLEEIRLRGAEQFHSTGGRDFVAVPCLNEHPVWIDAMTAIARRELSGWI